MSDEDLRKLERDAISDPSLLGRLEAAKARTVEAGGKVEFLWALPDEFQGDPGGKVRMKATLSGWRGVGVIDSGLVRLELAAEDAEDLIARGGHIEFQLGKDWQHEI